jgi:crooked neck
MSGNVHCMNNLSTKLTPCSIAPERLHNWSRYAEFEQDQQEWTRCRSIWERCLVVHQTNPAPWLRYVDSELKGRNINHAKNLLDRATTVLPRVDKLWFKYVYCLELLADVVGTRQVFNRWLQWEPVAEVWYAAIKFELRYQETDNARALYERLTFVHGEPSTWLKWARFEMEYGTPDLVRDVFSQSIEALGEDFMSEKIFMEYARFEAVRMHEHDRARAIYKFALDRMPRSKSVNLHKSYTTFEKQFGDSEGVEDVVLEKRRVQYEDELRASPKNYDAWLDLARLEERAGQEDRVRDVYERSVAQLPPSSEKRHWRRYLYLWLFYATYEELESKDVERTESIYKACLKLIPHGQWTSAKVWLNYAWFLVRQGRLTDARKALGTAIGKSPKNKLFKEYIELEKSLFEFDRARQLYTKWVSWDPSNAEAWKSFAELERGLADVERARAIYELAISEDVLDMPELLWKEFIDFEVDNEEYERARALYEMLLQKTSHVKVWTSYAQFEASVPDSEEEEATAEDEDQMSDAAKSRVRTVFERGYKSMKEQDLKEERVALLRAWESFEKAQGSPEDLEKVQKQMPSKVKKRRRLDDDTYEEYMDWVFPADNESEKKLSSLLLAAQRWKQAQEAQSGAA